MLYKRREKKRKRKREKNKQANRSRRKRSGRIVTIMIQRRVSTWYHYVNKEKEPQSRSVASYTGYYHYPFSHTPTHKTRPSISNDITPTPPLPLPLPLPPPRAIPISLFFFVLATADAHQPPRHLLMRTNDSALP